MIFVCIYLIVFVMFGVGGLEHDDDVVVIAVISSSSPPPAAAASSSFTPLRKISCA